MFEDVVVKVGDDVYEEIVGCDVDGVVELWYFVDCEFGCE